MDTEDTIWIPMFWYENSSINNRNYSKFTAKQLLVKFADQFSQYSKIKEELNFAVKNGIEFETRLEEADTFRSGACLLYTSDAADE